MLALGLQQAQVRRAPHQGDVERGEALRQPGALRDDGDAPRHRRGADAAHVDAVDRDLATLERKHAAQDAQQRRLAAAVRADDREQFAALRIQIDAAQHRPSVVTGLEVAYGQHQSRPRAVRPCRRSSNRKNGAPTSAVITPIGTSNVGSIVRAIMSATIRNEAPRKPESGSTRR